MELLLQDIPPGHSTTPVGIAYHFLVGTLPPGVSNPSDNVLVFMQREYRDTLSRTSAEQNTKHANEIADVIELNSHDTVICCIRDDLAVSHLQGMMETSAVEGFGTTWPIYGNNWTPLHVAAFFNRPEYIHFFHSQLFDIDSPAGKAGYSPLHVAVLHRSVSAIRTLIELGANIEAEATFVTAMHSVDENTPCTITPLNLAIELTQQPSTLPVVKCLLELGASVAPRVQDTGSLHLAIFRDDALECLAAILLGRDAEKQINGRDGEGWTALHLAVNQEKLPVVRLLLEHGADPNIRDIEGVTPFHMACRHASLRHYQFAIGEAPTDAVLRDLRLTCDVLAEFGARPDIKDNYGQTPQDFIDAWGIVSEQTPSLGVEQL